MLAARASQSFLRSLDRLQSGKLRLVLPNGQERLFEGKHPGAAGTLVLKEWGVLANLLGRGDLGFGEDYKDGKWETDNLTNLLEFGLQNAAMLPACVYGNPLGQLAARLRYALRRNSLSGSRRNIRAHYDLGNAFYQLWLDPSMTYSAALFRQPEASLEQAQMHKYDRITERLGKNSGTLLEIGCGWGGFAERALTQGDYAMKGITLSPAQQAYAVERLQGTGVTIALEDYRHQQGQFDHIVSIEMFEAVGEKFWKTYFTAVQSLLKASGRAVVQTITIDPALFKSYRRGSDFIRSHIFPGGMLPCPARFQAAAQQAGLRVLGTHAFGLDYARTLEHWLARFDASREAVLALGFDEAFIRTWRFYLAGCIASFKTQRTDVMQWELARA
jgi:cyclopropane-fatty-acyl-phospholipid synthase